MMSAWIIYDKNGLAKCEARQLQYSGEFMGACSINVNISSPIPIKFELGDWLEYRGERFELNYDPSVVKVSSSNTYGEGFQYENIVFNSLADELTRCDFLDYVPKDNELHYSSLPTFSFFADSITKLADRIQANLDRVYTDDKKWTVEVHPEYVNTLNVNITASNNTVWDALGFVNSKFGANFIIRGRKITIGTTGLAVGQLFSYGKGNGLYKIERNAESNQKVITRLRAYGSTRNMPTDYYHNVSGGNIPNNMAVRNLMLPSFPVQTHDPYIDSKNIEELGIREGTVFFDGSSEFEEIYPTMEGMTAEDLKALGINVNATGALDEILSAEQISDNGKFEPAEGEEQVTVPDFTISLKDVGFDLNDYLGTSSATISMKDGMCGGRDFEIVKCEKEGDGYKLTCHRHYDESLDLYFPYNSYQIKGGDKFVLLNIEMPDVYIKAASQRLLNSATAYLAKNDYVRYSYTLSVDNIFMARQHDEASINNETSIHDVIKEGDLMLFEDEDLGINGSITISSLSIKENADESIIPEYEITLQDEKTVGTIEKIQNQIANIISFGGGSETAINTEQVKSIIQAVGGKIFLSKTKDDRSKGLIASDKGFEVGKFVSGASGAIIYKDSETGQTIVELDKLYVRMKAYFETLVISEVDTISGKQIISPAGSIKCIGVDELKNAYRCYFLGEQDGSETTNLFHVNDQAYSQTFNAKQGEYNKLSNTYYWRLITDVSKGVVTYKNQKCYYIDLSKTDCDNGSDIPKEGDIINHRGSRTEIDRMNFIESSSVDAFSPNITLFHGVNSYSLDGKDYVSYGVDKTTNKAYMNVYGDMFVGDRNETSYMRYTQEGGLEIKGKLSVGTKFGDKDLKELIDNATPEGYKEFVEKVTQDIDNLQNQVDGAIDSYFYDYDPTLDNYPTVTWTTDSDKESHLGDTFTNNKSGDSWRWGLVDGNYQWIYIEDTATKKALSTASKAQDTADGKRRVFVGVSAPSVPYDKGDLWSRGVDYPLLVCEVSKTSSQSYSESDWGYADNTEKLNEEMKTLVNNTKSELEQSVLDAESAMKDYSDKAKEELQKNIDAVNSAKANVADVYDKATVDGIVDKAEAQAISKANEVAQAERELLETRVKAYADGEIDAAEQEAINEAQKRVDAAKSDLEDAIATLDTELRELVNTTASNLNTAIENAKKVANKYTDEAKADLQNAIDEMELSKANLADVYTQAQADEKISQSETDAINAAKAQSDAAIALSETIIKAYADGIVDDEESARIKQAQENLAEAKKYAEQKAQEALDDALSSLSTFDYLKSALKEDTSIEGGLVQSSLIKLGYTSSNTFKVMSGTNGIYNTSLIGGGIASWWGGDTYDLMDYYTWDGTKWVVKSGVSVPSNIPSGLIRFDGTGYFAKGKFWWDANGEIHADPTALLLSFDASTGDETLASTIVNIRKDIATFLDMFEVRKDGDGREYLYSKRSLATNGGVTMYANVGDLNIPSIYDGLPIDGSTIYWENGVLKANVTEGVITNITSDMVVEALGFTPYNASNPKGYISGITSAMIVSALGYTPLQSHQTIHALTIQKNGTNIGTYTPNSAKKTINIVVPTKVSELDNDEEYATTSDLDSRIDALINGAPTAFDTLKEIADVLQGNVNSIGDIITTLGTKADKAIKISAGTGLSGGGTLEADITLSLATSGVTAGTYKSVTVDKYGRVTSGTNPTTLAGYGITDAYTKIKVDELLGNYVTLSTEQTITGKKNFTGGLEVNGSPIVYDATNKYWKLEGDLLVTGGVTMYASESSFTPSAIMDAIATDGTNLKVVNGVLTFIGSIDGGEAGSVAWENVTGKPSWIGASKPSYAWSEITSKPSFASVATSGKYDDLIGKPTLLSSFTDDIVSGKYLPLTGGTLNSALTIKSGIDDKIIFNNTGGEYYTRILFQEQGEIYGQIICDKSGFALHHHNLLFNSKPVYHKGILGTLKTDLGLGSNAYTSTEFLPSASYTASDVLAKLLTVDGIGSGLDADYLGGYRYDRFALYTVNDSYVNFSFVNQNLQAKGQGEGYIEYWDSYGWYNSKWGKVTALNGFVGNLNGNASTATKLETKRKIWGQGFDGTGDIDTNTSGMMRVLYFSNSSGDKVGYVGRGSESNDIYLTAYGEDSLRFRNGSSTKATITPNGNVLIGTDTDSGYKLDVNGVIHASKAFNMELSSSMDSGLTANGHSIVRATIDGIVISPIMVATKGIYFRPKGSHNTTGEAILDASGRFNVPSLNVGGDIPIYKSQDGVLYIDGNLAVKGGITMYAEDEVNIPSIIDSLPIAGYTSDAKGIAAFDPSDFVITDGVVSYIGTSSGVDESFLSSYLVTNNYAKKSDIPSIPTSLKNPYSLTFGTKTYDGSSSQTITASDLGALTQHQDLSGYQTKITSSNKLAYSLISGTPTSLSSFTNDRGYITASALSGYATESYVIGRGYITASALNGYATSSWVNSNFLSLSGGTITGALTVNNIIYSNTIRSMYNRFMMSDDGNTTQVFGGNYNGSSTIINGNKVKICANDKEIIAINDGGVTINQSTWNNGLCLNRTVSGGGCGISVFSNGTELGQFGIAGIGRFEFDTLSGTKFYVDANGNGDFTGYITCKGNLGIGGVSGVNTSINLYSYDNSGYQFSNRVTDGKMLRIYYRSSDGQFTNVMELGKTGNLLVTGGITMYSDQRKKTILNHVELSLKQIADAPLIEHYYNSDEKKTTHVGSIAQYWANMNDWFCKLDSEGFYTMEIQNAALASAISIARELDRYETKTDKAIKKLKKRISELEDEVERLKSA